MSIRNELDKSIPGDVELTEREKTRIRYRVHQSTSNSKLSLKPVIVSVFCFMIAGILLLANIKPMINDQSAPNQISTNERDQLSPRISEEQQKNDTNQLLPKIPDDQITEEQKQQYYEEYKEILDTAKKQMVANSLSLQSKERFEENGWVKPEKFEEMLQNNVEKFLNNKISGNSWKLKPAITKNGVTKKSTIIYFPNSLKEIEVTAEFDTQYSKDLGRDVFKSVENVSTEFAYPQGTWEQISVKPKLLDGGKKYRIQIEGTWTYTSITYEKIFTIEFNCDEEGNIS